MTVVDRFVQAVAHGGVMSKPTLIVVHSAETPLKAGYANSIATNWFGSTTSGVTTSAHFMVDPVECIRMLSDNVVAYAVGPNANGFTLNIEQAGYARFSRAEWTTADGMAQLGKVGALIGELSAAHQIPLRWATDDQIRAAAKGVPGGVCFHDDIHRVLGGTTHTDPIPNYPGDLLEQAWNGTIEEDFMATMSDAEKARLLDFIDRAPIYIWNDQNGNPLILERNGGKPRDARSVQGDIYVHTVALLQQVAGLTAAVNTLAAGAAGAGTTAEELRTVIREEMAKAIDVQVTVNGTKAGS